MPSSRPVSAARLHGGVDLLDAGLAAERADEVDDRAVRHGDAHRHAVELALELGDHDPDRARGAGRGRDDRERRGARAAQVVVRHVVQALIARVGVRRRHEARLDAELVQQHAHDGRQAVGRARRHRDELVLVAVVGLLVDAEHERDVGILGGRGDDDLARAGGDVRLGAAVGEEARSTRARPRRRDRPTAARPDRGARRP